MEAQQKAYGGHWDRGAVVLTIVSLTCGWLYAFYPSAGSPNSTESDERNIQALLMQDDKEKIRLATDDINGLRTGYEKEGRAGEYYVRVRFDEPPIRGENRLAIIVLDSSRKKVTGATVEIEYLMPSLPGRPPMMDYKTTAREENGAYHADVKISMTGEWILKVNITKANKAGTFQFPVEVLN